MNDIEIWAKMTDQEKRLAEMCEEYEREFFADVWQIETIKTALEWGADFGYMLSITGNCFFKVKKLRGDTVGQYNRQKKTITISPENLRKSVVLHEMIHFYESTIERINPAINEFWMLMLYNKLKEQVADLDGLILGHGELFGLDRLERSGGRHGLLFMLKSLELDLRLGLPLGSVFGYDKREELEKMGVL